MTKADAEFQALRATIRERGSLRVLIFTIGLSAWALAWAWLSSSSFLPFIAMVPLALLAGIFEAVNALHVGVERIGRYVEVFHEEPRALDPDPRLPRWETTMTEFGRRFRGNAADPLFSSVFATAVLLNLLPVAMLRPKTAEWVFFGLVHLAVLSRLIRARRRALEQRAADLDSFRTLYRASAPTTPTTTNAGSEIGSTVSASSSVSSESSASSSSS